MMEIPNENKKPVNLQLIGVSAANQMNATAREQSNRPLDEQQRQSL